LLDSKNGVPTIKGLFQQNPTLFLRVPTTIISNNQLLRYFVVLLSLFF
jgi:hypothetical protein